MPLVMTPAAQQTPQASTPLASLIPAGMAFTAEGSGGPSAARARKQAPMVLPLPSTLGQLLRGGLVLEGLHEGFGCQSEVDLANLRAFALALASWRFQMARGAVVWVQQGPDVQLSLALPAFGLELNRFVSVRTSADRDALWSAEELCESQGVAALLVEVNRFDLLASRRLQLRLEQVAAELGARLDQLVCRRTEEPNYGKALREGILHARGDIVLCDEIDLCDTDFYERALAALQDPSVDFVVGSKVMEGALDERPLFRRLGTIVINRVLRATLGLKGSDTHGLKAFRTEPVQPIARACLVDRDLFASELVIRAERAGLGMREIPVRVLEKRPPTIGLVRRLPKVLKNLVKLVITIRIKK